MRTEILLVNLNVPGQEEHMLSLDSDRSLLDADIIAFAPGIPPEAIDESGSFQGKPSLDESWSFRVKELFNHWRSELELALEQGKTVIIYLTAPTDVFVETGNKEYSGTGRNRQVIHKVAPLRSYDAIPFAFSSIVPKGGTAIQVATDLKHVAEYWQSMSQYSHYDVHVTGEFSTVLLTTRAPDRVVGADVRAKGMLLFLPPVSPPVSYEDETFTRAGESEDGEDPELEYWTNDALAFGVRWLQALVSIDEHNRAEGGRTPQPEWAQKAIYRLSAEASLAADIARLEEKIGVLAQERSAKALELQQEGKLRALLFAKGRELEEAIIVALRLLGFLAESHHEGESEFDVVFMAPEGRFLAEAEGKDTKAVDVDKCRQLETNIQEDFARDGVDTHAKGVLFGNAHRLLPVEERGAFFTTKCVSSAKRMGAALVRTPDLFHAAKAIREGASQEYAAECRAAIASSVGTVVTFPGWVS